MDFGCQNGIEKMAPWVDELIVATVGSIVVALFLRFIQKSDETRKAVLENSKELDKYRNKTDSILSTHKAKIEHLESGINEVKEFQKETNRKLDELIKIQLKAHGLKDMDL